MIDDRTRERLVQKIAFWKQGEQDCPYIDGKPAKLLRVGIICKSDGDREYGSPWDLREGIDAPGQIADMILERFQELADGRSGLATHAAATFFFEGPSGGLRKWQRTFELTLMPANENSEFMPTMDMRRPEVAQGVTITQVLNQLVQMSQVQVSHTQSLGQMFASVTDVLGRELRESRADARAAWTEARVALDSATDRAIKVKQAESRLRMQESFMDAAKPGISVGVAGLLQAGAKVLGIEPVPIEKDVIEILTDMSADPVKLNKALDDLGVTPSQRQKLMNVMLKAEAAKRAQDVKDDADVASTGATPLSHAKFKVKVQAAQAAQARAKAQAQNQPAQRKSA